MTSEKSKASPRRWAELRFLVVGPLLAHPPPAGQLRAALEERSKLLWPHPVTGDLVSFGVSTIERWYYLALDADDPIAALTSRVRRDRGTPRAMSPALLKALEQQYRQYPSWSRQLHLDNLVVLCEQDPERMGKAPSLSTVRRRMVDKGMDRHREPRDPTEGQKLAAQRLERREVRSYEASHVHLLWHYDFHQCSRRVVLADGSYVTPWLLGILDDCSRLCCHLQWYLAESAENLFHGLSQAYLKYGLPRSEMHDNGAAMRAAEIVGGAKRLGIEQYPTLPYSPYQNGKQEHFWTTVEGRLMEMVRKREPLELAELNRMTVAWVEMDYNRAVHSELGQSPIERVLQGPDVSRKSPSFDDLRQRFVRTRHARVRRSDGTISLHGVRFEVPSRLRTLTRLLVGYRRWDLSSALVLDERTEQTICRLFPLDKQRNASGRRRTLEPLDDTSTDLDHDPEPDNTLPPLMEKILRDFAATGLPPPFVPKDELPTKPQDSGDNDDD